MYRSRRVVLAGAAVLAVSSGVGVLSTPPAVAVSSCATPGALITVAYDSKPGVPADALSLDIHAPDGQVCDAPVVMWVHGGSYTSGDKANQMDDKTALFNQQGWLLVSVNYRLTVPGDASSAHYPDHYEDVARAVTWVHDTIAQYGGDPTRIALLGHSAGADIVANVADNPTYLQNDGLDLSALRCAGPLDTEGFDKPSASSSEQAQWQEALGNDPNYEQDTSPTLYVHSAETGVPPTIGVYRGTAERQSIEENYINRLNTLSIPTSLIDARPLTHEEVNSSIGAPGDSIMTPPLMDFLTGCLSS